MRKHLTDTDTGGLQSLGINRRPVLEQWRALREFLATRMDVRELELFAEPQFQGPQRISWFSGHSGEHVLLKTKPKKVQAALLQTVKRRLVAYQLIVDELKQSASSRDRQFGQILYFATCMPAQNALDNIWVAGDEPVLVNWGMRDQEPGSVARPLDLAQHASVAIASEPLDYLSMLLWLLFLIACFLLWKRLLPACSVGGIQPGFCLVATQAGEPELEQDELLTLLSRMNTQQNVIPELAQCDAGTSAYLADNRPLRSEPTVPILPPEVPQDPQDFPDSVQNDLNGEAGLALNTELSQASAVACDADIVLSWDVPDANLDLNLLCPFDDLAESSYTPEEGQIVSTEFPQGCGATYDIASSEELPGTTLDRICIDGDGVPGTYLMGVLHVDSTGASSTPVPYQVVFRQGQETVVHEGMVAPASEALVPIEITMQ